ncbi:unnamed protein product [Brassica rapa subsp. narinosa]
MSSSAVVAAQSAGPHATFDDLGLGRSTQFIVGRVLSFGDSSNIKKNGEFIHAACANQYRVSQRTGAIVKVVRFNVGRCTNMYKIKDHPFVICLIPTTTTILTAAPFIDFQKFMLRKFHHLQALANTNFELPDVVAQIRSFQVSALNNVTATTRVVPKLTHTCSSSRNLLYLNSTPATKFYFDTTIPAIEAFTERSVNFSWEVQQERFSHVMTSPASAITENVLVDPLPQKPEAEKAPEGDVQSGQATSSACDTGSSNTKEVDEANLQAWLR